MERPAAAKAAGFDYVEFWWPFDSNPVPTDKAVEGFIASIIDAGTQLKGLNFWAGNMKDGDRGRLSSPGYSSEVADNADIVSAIGQRTGCRNFNALYGLREHNCAKEVQDEIAIKNLQTAAEAVKKINGTVLIEPVSGADRYPIKTEYDAVTFISTARNSGIENVALLADFYHLAVNGDDVDQVIKSHAAEFGHIQIADAPGRGAPGTGNLPLLDWVTSSYEAGYVGKVSLEYKQSQDTAFVWLS